MSTKLRRYDIDWLRVIVFAVLIIYHVGMFFVPWGWHIKNNTLYEWLEWPMIFVSYWRLPILFVISGMGTRFALAHRAKGQYVSERLKRLGIPLIAGMLIIIPPQVYVERLVSGDFSGSYWAFYTSAAFSGIYPEGNISWHHLWFLPYLLLLSLVLTPIFIYLRNHPKGAFLEWIRSQMMRPWGLLWIIIPLWLAESFLEPHFNVTHALVGDWFALIYYLLFFLSGYILIAIQDQWWAYLRRMKWFALVLGTVCFSSLYFIQAFDDGWGRHLSEALIKIINIWSWITVIFAFGAQYLNKPSTVLSYCNAAVYPFYIFHQTITIVLGYQLMNLDWGFWSKFLILTLGTFVISWLMYELVRRIKPIRPLFGLK